MRIPTLKKLKEHWRALSTLLVPIEQEIEHFQPSPSSSVLTLNQISMDLMTREVRRGGRMIELQVKEFALLEFFMRNPGTVLTKAQILEKVWNYNFDPGTNVLDVLICRLREKVD